MKLEQLYRNFALMPEEEQLTFFEGYKAKRHYDLVEATVIKVDSKGKRRAAEKKISVTPEALELLKKLGLV